MYFEVPKKQSRRAAFLFKFKLSLFFFISQYIHTSEYTGCPQINFTFLNVNRVRTNIRIATTAVYINRGDL